MHTDPTRTTPGNAVADAGRAPAQTTYDKQTAHPAASAAAQPAPRGGSDAADADRRMAAALGATGAERDRVPAPHHAQRADDALSAHGAARAARPNVSDAARNVGTIFSEGVSALRAVSSAHRAHAEAKSALKELLAQIEENTDLLDHRREVARDYDAIVAAQTAERDKAERDEREAAAAQEGVAGTLAELERRLKAMQDEDDLDEKRLRDAWDEARANEKSARDGLEIAEHGLAEAQQMLDQARATQERTAASAQRDLDEATAELDQLRAEYAKIQRTPSANSAAYSVKSEELELKISDAAARRTKAQLDIPRLGAASANAVAAAEDAVAEARLPLEQAEKFHRGTVEAAERAQAELDSARKAAERRQRSLRDEISGVRKAQRDREQAVSDAQARREVAEALIAEAEEIHAHPEKTEELARTLAAQVAERDERQQAVAALAEQEQGIRARTHAERVRLGLAAAAVAAVILVIVIIVTALG